MTEPASTTRRPRRRRRWTRRTLWLLVLLLVTIVGAYTYLANPQRAARLAAGLLGGMTGAEVRIVEAHFDLRGKIVLHRLLLRLPPETGRSDTLFQAQRVFIDYNIGALLTGQFDPNMIVITRPVIYLTEDLETQKEHGTAAKRRQQIMRIALEAQEQGGLLTQEDLALILDSDVRTIRSDIRKLQQEAQIVVPTRGTVRDIGPGVSLKRKAHALWLSGKEALEVARQLNHSLTAVERYIQTFCRVVYAQRRMRNTLKTAMVVGISVASANSYFDLHEELMAANGFYRKRLEEVLALGEAHWEAVDDPKKSPSPRPGRKPRRPR